MKTKKFAMILAVFIVIVTMLSATIGYDPNILQDERPDDHSTRTSFSLFSPFGVDEACSEYPEQTKVFTGSKLISCNIDHSLINLYWCVNNAPNCDDGWAFVDEWVNPHYWNDPAGNVYVYECYSCPEGEAECDWQGDECVSYSEFANCDDGELDDPEFCGFNSYCQNGDCIDVDDVCIENWGCTTWGVCNAQSKQYRSCDDNNDCGTSKNKPDIVQNCQVPVVEPEGEFASIPEINKVEVVPGEPVIITVDFQAITEGNYLLEAGIEKVGGLGLFSLFNVNENFCNPGQTWYANKLIHLTPGQHILNFEVTPGQEGEGTYQAHVALVKSCGGDVIEQVNIDTLVKVETEKADEPSPEGLTCSDCGAGFQTCDQDECEALGSCEFISKWYGGQCVEVIEPEDVCTPDFGCTEFGDCLPTGMQERTCSDSQECGQPEYTESISCELDSPCVPAWSIGEFGICSKHGLQSRLVQDANDCGTQESKPIVTQNCIYEPEYPSCTDKSNCEADELCKENLCEKIEIDEVCTPQWDCDDFGLCNENNFKYRLCTDSQECGSSEGFPGIKEACDYVAPDTESSEVKNLAGGANSVDTSSPTVSIGSNLESSEVESESEGFNYTILIAIAIGAVVIFFLFRGFRKKPRKVKVKKRR